MSSTARHALEFAVGLILTIGLLYIGISLYQRSADYAKTVQKKQENDIERIKYEDIMKYDGTVRYGSDIVTYIKNVINEHEKTVYLEKGVNRYVLTDSSFFGELQNPTADRYVDPYKRYFVTVQKDLNDIISSVTITEQ